MLIVSNWKAYIDDIKKAKKLVETAKRVGRTSKHTLVLAPSAPFIAVLATGNRSKVQYGAQDISITTGGAHTGEVTAATVRSAGATYVIVGHSERRAAGDSDSVVAEKLSRAIAHGLIPVLCVGEHVRDTEGHYLAFLREELTSALRTLTAKERAQVVIAYEPLWAIGKTAADAIGTPELTEMTLYIRKVLAELLPGKSSSRSLILYGGSVEPDNIRELGRTSGIDGFLIGHASVDPVTYTELVKQLS